MELELKRRQLMTVSKVAAILFFIGAAGAVGYGIYTIIQAMSTLNYFQSYESGWDNTLRSNYVQVILQALSWLLEQILPIGQYIIYGLALWRVGKTGRPFAPEIRRLLKWVAGFVILSAILYVMEPPFTLNSVASLALYAVVAIVLWVWPVSLKDGDALQQQNDELL